MTEKDKNHFDRNRQQVQNASATVICYVVRTSQTFKT